MAPGKTQVALNQHLAPHAAFVLDPVAASFGEEHLHSAIEAATSPEAVHTLPATRIATQVFGDAIATNMMMLGFALQSGWLPVSLQALQRAIEINGASVKANLAALDWGRHAALDLPGTLRKIAPAQPIAWQGPSSKSLETLIQGWSAELRAYQDDSYAQRYAALMQQVQEAEQKALPRSTVLTRIVARQAFRLMAYKDEYEVARLYTDGRFDDKLKAQFTGELQLTFHLAPPLLAKRNPVTGHLKKQAFGPWVLTAMRLLTRFKGLRGGAWDPFGKTPERFNERLLAAMYPNLIATLLPTLTAATHPQAVALAKIAEEVRGFGHVKDHQLAVAALQWQAACQGTPAEALVLAFVDNLRINARPHAVAATRITGAT